MLECHQRDSLLKSWTDVMVAATTAPMLFASQASAAAISLWGSDVPASTSTSVPRAVFDHSRDRVASGASNHGTTARSWYRAPYRSPFDPMFWLSSGHPVDHYPAAAATAFRLGAQAVAQGVPATTAFASASPQDWLALWPLWSMSTPAVSPLAKQAAASNVVDFKAAYAAYRTAGGHASAQIIRAPSAALPEVAVDLTQVAWPFSLFFAPWMAR